LRGRAELVRRMGDLSRLERAASSAIAAQASESADALARQMDGARVIARENTGADFFTTFDVDSDRLLVGLRSPVGDVGAIEDGLKYGMGLLLWIKGGKIHQLEGCSNAGEDTSGLDFARIEFQNVEARRPPTPVRR
jgi:hypothetical protein